VLDFEKIFLRFGSPPLDHSVLHAALRADNPSVFEFAMARLSPFGSLDTPHRNAERALREGALK
jgi:hypothetical protein